MWGIQREGMGLQEYQAMPSLREIARDDGCVHLQYSRLYWRYCCRAGLFGSIGIIHANSSPWASVRTVNTQWGRRIYSSTNLNPNTITSIQRPHPADKTTSKLQPKYVLYLCTNLLINLHNVPINEINIQKERHWPPNIITFTIWQQLKIPSDRSWAQWAAPVGGGGGNRYGTEKAGGTDCPSRTKLPLPGYSPPASQAGRRVGPAL